MLGSMARPVDDFTLRKIMVSTDFSKLGDAAFAAAFRLAADHRASLLAVHVLDLPETPSPLYAHYMPLPSPAQLSEAKVQALAELEGRLAGARQRGVSARAVLVAGDPAVEIVRLAAARRISLIVLATHGRTGIRRFALGSVAEKVVRTAPCAVMVIR